MFYYSNDSPGMGAEWEKNTLFNMITIHYSHGDHSFSTFAEFSEKLTFFTPLYAYVGKKLGGIKLGGIRGY